MGYDLSGFWKLAAANMHRQIEIIRSFGKQLLYTTTNSSSSFQQIQFLPVVRAQP